MSVRIPKYRHHKPTDQALVEIRGRRIYLGKYDSEESKEKYRRIIAEHVSGKGIPAEPEQSAELSINELILRYFRFAESYYTKNGKPTDEIAALRAIFKRLRGLYGRTAAADFGPKRFRLLRDTLINEGLSRKYINESMARIKRMFKWGVAEELVSPIVHQAMSAVGGLKKGRSNARETENIQPVSDEIVEATLPHLPEVVADMVRLQRLTGMRPAEVCLVRPCDIDRSGQVWVYRPMTHKTEHAGRERIVPIGPRAQGIVLSYLARDASTYCFQPRDSEKKRYAARLRSRKTPLELGNQAGSNRVQKPKRQAGTRYKTASYRRAIHRACDKAFPHVLLADEERNGLSDADLAELKAWRTRNRWSPNQLRHSAATEFRQKYGLEVAQTLLGHSRADVTQIYAERDISKALDVAGRIYTNESLGIAPKGRWFSFTQ